MPFEKYSNLKINTFEVRGQFHTNDSVMAIGNECSFAVCMAARDNFRSDRSAYSLPKMAELFLPRGF